MSRGLGGRHQAVELNLACFGHLHSLRAVVPAKPQQMNIRELIEQLQAFPPDTPVLVDSYESGLIEAQSPIMEPVVFNYRNANYAGPHESVEYVIDYPDKVHDIRNAVILARTPWL